MSIRDLLTHRLGFTNDPVIWRTSYSGVWTDEQLFSILERDSVSTPRQFSYDNLGYILTTYAVEERHRVRQRVVRIRQHDHAHAAMRANYLQVTPASTPAHSISTNPS